MPEYGGGGPFWNMTGVGRYDFRMIDVPLSEDLRRRVQTWCEGYWATLDQNYPPDSDFLTPEARQAWLVGGRAIAQQVANELAGRATILYVDYGTGDTVEIPPTH
ncbi:MAG: hypothetical protein JO020_19175 [Chloroflexi bacterium]|nr:hypothetical protein [Chloroflexota bacterium]